ncbi:MAG TPA: bifunctional sugar-1-phosphate nucleotidylyltransferase/acetyltransferase [archaeon]|nr:bifunctional sugar-1-phosphate nucleotidylyltransferase/acetyltransferase [archaeon]
MKGVILCGGIGKRMYPITEDKFLLKFLGKTLLEHQIETMLKVGIKDFIVVCNPINEDKIKNYFKNLKIKIEFAVQKEPKGMADALISAKHILDGEIIVINANDYCDAEAYEKILDEDKKDVDSIILGYKVSSYFPGGYLRVSDKSDLIEIVEKPGEGNEPSDMVNIVVHYHKDAKKIIEYFEKTRSEKDDIYERAMSKMSEDGCRIKVIPFSGTFIPFKYPWHAFELLKYFLDNSEARISNTAKISPKANIEGKVIIEDNVKIFEGAFVKGPCYIGKNSVIGTNVLIWNYSQIGDCCVVGYSTEIKKSFIADNCWFHTNYIGDSIIANNCSFGAGAVTANFRFDEKNVKVNVNGQKIDTGLDKFGVIMGDNCKAGVNASIMPGVKVGPNSIIEPGVVAAEDVEANKIISMKKEYLIKENKIEYTDKKEELLRRILKGK